jgi:hypothetical protein
MNKTVLYLILALLGVGVCYFTISRAAIGACPSDDVLVRSFAKDSARFAHLSEMIEADGRRVSYVGRGVVTVEGLRLSPEREKEYLAEIKNLGVVNLYQNAGELTIWFWFDAVSIASRSRSKGIALFLDLKKYRYKVESRLDGLEDTGTDGVYVRPLSGNWYIIYLQSS